MIIVGIDVFPTHVGVNREPGGNPPRAIVFPTHVGVNRTCNTQALKRSVVFPTHVGVNRGESWDDRAALEYSPRTWG